jgi:hypothetical protein
LIRLFSKPLKISENPIFWMGLLGAGLLGARVFGQAGAVTVDAQSQAAILSEADDIFKEVSWLRGLPIKKPVEKKFENRIFFRDYYSRLLNEQYPPAKKAAYEKAYSLFGFLPENTDLIRTYLDSFLMTVQGLYDPRSKTLYIADWINPDDLEGTLAHELDHALQDQYFDLQAYLEKGKNASMDTQFARSSVMEGEAVAISLNYSLEDRGLDFTQLANIADWANLTNYLQENGAKAFGRKVVLHDVINFPYIYGTSFLQKYIKVYGWQGMGYLFEHPPTSTHQIMHPEIFFSKREIPVRVSIDDLSKSVLPGYGKIWENTFGEYGLFLLLRQFLQEGEAQKSVRGWKGDLLQVYEGNKDGQLVLAGYIVFNNDDSAVDFFESYRSLLNKKYEVELFRRSDDTIHWASLKLRDREVYVERVGRRVVIIEGTHSEQTPKVRALLWNVVAGKLVGD